MASFTTTESTTVNELMAAAMTRMTKLWDEIGVELMTKQANGSTLDRFNILEATHLSVTCHDNNDGDDGSKKVVNSGGV